MKPAVATSAVRAPLSVSSAFVPTVIPWAKRSTSPGAAPARSSAASIARATPSDWSLGVVGAFAGEDVGAVEDDGVGERTADVDTEEHCQELAPNKL